MPSVQCVNAEDIPAICLAAAEKCTPARLSYFDDAAWRIVPCQMLACKGRLLTMQPAEPEKGAELLHREEFGVSFKYKHHKHMFTGRVVDIADDGARFSLARPDFMFRIQRRAFTRVDVPTGRIVRASLWLGGLANEPDRVTDANPVWPGRVTNFSAGGAQVYCDNLPWTVFQTGELFGLRLAFGQDTPSVYSDAQLRRCDAVDASGAALAFQLVGLAHTDHGRKSLDILADKTAEFQRISKRRVG
jgi:c-di-GMP-binding flagellar brake protein YcgR